MFTWKESEWKKKYNQGRYDKISKKFKKSHHNVGRFRSHPPQSRFLCMDTQGNLPGLAWTGSLRNNDSQICPRRDHMLLLHSRTFFRPFWESQGLCSLTWLTSLLGSHSSSGALPMKYGGSLSSLGTQTILSWFRLTICLPSSLQPFPTFTSFCFVL